MHYFRIFSYAYYFFYVTVIILHNLVVFYIHLNLKLMGAVLGIARKLNEGNVAEGPCKIFSPLNKSTPKIFLTVDVYKT